MFIFHHDKYSREKIRQDKRVGAVVGFRLQSSRRDFGAEALKKVKTKGLEKSVPRQKEPPWERPQGGCKRVKFWMFQLGGLQLRHVSVPAQTQTGPSSRMTDLLAFLSPRLSPADSSPLHTAPLPHRGHRRSHEGRLQPGG